MVRGAGGTNGGVGRFFIGFIMMCSGLYLLLQSITVSTGFGIGMYLFGTSLFGQHIGITSGMVLFPFMFGIGMIFYNAKNYFGWLLAVGSMTAMIFGVIASTHFVLRTLTAYELLTILVLSFGGLGLFLSSLRRVETKTDKNNGTSG